MEIHRDRKYGMIWLSQQKYVDNILKNFGIDDVKPVNIPLYFHCNISPSLCPSNEEEKGYMSRVSYSSRNFYVCDAMVRYFTCFWSFRWKHGKYMYNSEMGASIF